MFYIKLPEISPSMKRIHNLQIRIFEIRSYSPSLAPNSTFIFPESVVMHELMKRGWKSTVVTHLPSFINTLDTFPTLEAAYIAKLKALNGVSAQFDARIKEVEQHRIKAFGSSYELLQQAYKEHPEYFI